MPNGPATPNRDLNTVLVTGAGASRALGVNGTKLPLMGDWSAALVTRLREKGAGYLEATQLREDMPPEDFEARLGDFLRAVEGFKRAGPLLEPLAMMGPPGSSPIGPQAWEHWHAQGATLLDDVTQVIHKSLYELFADPSIDPGLPQQAYGSLFRALGLNGTRWVYATTNYDRIGELAISLLGALPDVGEVAFDPAVTERPLRVTDLLDGMPRYVPVLHLHGRVGWFLRRGVAYSVPVTAYEPAHGTPVIMLPDLEKSYEDVGIITPLWRQFEEALSRATRVLVLGHSLHDEALLRALRTNVQPLERIAVTFLPSTDDSRPTDESELKRRVAEQLPGAAAIPMRFAAGVDFDTDDLRRWSERAAGFGGVI